MTSTLNWAFGSQSSAFFSNYDFAFWPLASNRSQNVAATSICWNLDLVGDLGLRSYTCAHSINLLYSHFTADICINSDKNSIHSDESKNKVRFIGKETRTELKQRKNQRYLNAGVIDIITYHLFSGKINFLILIAQPHYTSQKCEHDEYGAVCVNFIGIYFYESDFTMPTPSHFIFNF